MSERLECEVLVVGAGPAGLAAAVAAAQKHFKVILIDENPSLGGQIWRQIEKVQSHWLALLFAAKVRVVTGSVFDLPEDGKALASFPEGHAEIRFQKLILCTGARELFLPFPGWTLPGVFGVGGLQTLVKQGLKIRDKRVIIAGTGPLLLAVGKHLDHAEANLHVILDQAPPGSLRNFALALWRYPHKIGQAFSFLWTAQRLQSGWWIRRALGHERLEAVEITDGREVKRVECDYLACSYGLTPNTELAQLAGCRTHNGFVWIDSHQRTSNDRIFCAGEPVQIGGADAAIIQGTIAGLSAVGSETYSRIYFREREKCRAFSEGLEKAYRLRQEVLQLACDDTVVCRCEDVRFGDIKDRTSFREAKLHTRLGMGPCQGRVCGAACQTMFGWDAPTVRPPICPVAVDTLMH